jgi:hypothetical protein
LHIVKTQKLNRKDGRMTAVIVGIVLILVGAVCGSFFALTGAKEPGEYAIFAIIPLGILMIMIGVQTLER